MAALAKDTGSRLRSGSRITVGDRRLGGFVPREGLPWEGVELMFNFGRVQHLHLPGGKLAALWFLQ